jgi:hypothetical protein
VLPLNGAGVWAWAKQVTLSMKTSQANLDKRIELPNRNLDIQQEILLHRPRKRAYLCRKQYKAISITRGRPMMLNAPEHK